MASKILYCPQPRTPRSLLCCRSSGFSPFLAALRLQSTNWILSLLLHLFNPTSMFLTISLKPKPTHVAPLLKTLNDFLLFGKKKKSKLLLHGFQGLLSSDSPVPLQFHLFLLSMSPGFQPQAESFNSSLTHHTSPSLLISVHLKGPFAANGPTLPTPCFMAELPCASSSDKLRHREIQEHTQSSLVSSGLSH